MTKKSTAVDFLKRVGGISPLSDHSFMYATKTVDTWRACKLSTFCRSLLERYIKTNRGKIVSFREYINLAMHILSCDKFIAYRNESFIFNEKGLSDSLYNSVMSSIERGQLVSLSSYKGSSRTLESGIEDIDSLYDKFQLYLKSVKFPKNGLYCYIPTNAELQKTLRSKA